VVCLQAHSQKLNEEAIPFSPFSPPIPLRNRIPPPIAARGALKPVMEQGLRYKTKDVTFKHLTLKAKDFAFKDDLQGQGLLMKIKMQ